ncbi:hypothetical protein VZT92_005784 [Zoarces viviparus]
MVVARTGDIPPYHYSWGAHRPSPSYDAGLRHRHRCIPSETFQTVSAATPGFAPDYITGIITPAATAFVQGDALRVPQLSGQYCFETPHTTDKPVAGIKTTSPATVIAGPPADTANRTRVTPSSAAGLQNTFPAVMLPRTSCARRPPCAEPLDALEHRTPTSQIAHNPRPSRIHHSVAHRTPPSRNPVNVRSHRQGPIGPLCGFEATIHHTTIPTRTERKPAPQRPTLDRDSGCTHRAHHNPPVVALRIPLVRTSSKSAARRQPRRSARSPRERDPTGTVAGEIREKGPARVQSRRHRPPNPIPSTGPTSTRRQTPPPENLRNSDAVRHHRQRPREAGRAPRFQRRREAGDGMTAPPAAARAQPRFAPQPDRPSP